MRERKIKRVAIYSFVVTVMILVVSSCSSGVAPATVPATGAEVSGSRLGDSIGGLGPGDVIAVTFSGAPEQNLRQRIRGDGKVSLPMVGDVTAGGKSLVKFQGDLVRLYGKHLTDPSLVVSRESTAAAVYVSGGVNSPTKISLERPMTALEAIMEAGGFSTAGNPRQVTIIRNEGVNRKRYVLDLRAALDGHSTTPFYLRPYDVISVAKRVW